MIGRPSSDIRTHFNELPREAVGPHKRAECKACGKVYQMAQAQRLLHHVVNQCSSAPVTVKTLLAPQLHVKKRKAQQHTHFRSPDKTPRQKHMSTPTVSTTRRTQAQFLIDIAFLFHAMGLSFRAIEHSAFRWFMSRYLPEYELPTRQHLGGKLLLDVYDREKKRVISELRSQSHMSLVTDGWTDANGEHILNFIVVSTGLRPIFWNAVRTKDDTKDGPYIAAKLKAVINELESYTSKRISGLVSDNASNMSSAASVLHADRPDIIRVGCIAHVLNLVLEDVFKVSFFKKIREDAVTVVKYIKKRIILLARFRSHQNIFFRKQKGRRCLVLPVSTRWYSTHRCIGSVLGNKHVLRTLFSDQRAERLYGKCGKYARAKNIVHSSRFWEDANAVVKMIRPITRAIAELERDDCGIALVYEYFTRLLHHECYSEGSSVDSEHRYAVRAIIKNRWESHRVPVYNVAYLLDPMVSINGFVDEECQQAVRDVLRVADQIGYDENLLEKLKCELGVFVRRKSSWNSDDINANREDFDGVMTWWSASKLRTLADFAQRILCIPASSASSERSWSQFQHVQSPKRHRIEASTLDKLVFVYSNSGDIKRPVSKTLYRVNDGDDRSASSISSDSGSFTHDLDIHCEYNDDSSDITRHLNFELSDEDENEQDRFIMNHLRETNTICPSNNGPTEQRPAHLFDGGSLTRLDCSNSEEL